ncbi:phosphopyruvate hydratase [Caproiciproducens faecalis]|uniref:Enolase n=1 Tax=Caproiciproducens faecalis TaxID=2820301 RepID=A0ABS7DJD7_9FIRM|nr:phosphopyruvate hydratase [Caproiciproducens faecalis]MBW7571408.1 phosphopyruvate hydratase [Caproiciproducens faecalis]
MTDFRIREIKARQIFDSRANPTVEVDVILENGIHGRGIAPSGASTGQFEALELRDGDPARLDGKGVSKAIHNVLSVIAPALIGMDARNQAEIDRKMIELDGTPNKSNLGANAILPCSMAVAYAAANAMGLPLFRYLGGANAKVLPVPMIQIIGGGAHAVNSIDIQDFLVIPMSAVNFAQAFEMVVNVYNAAKKVFTEHQKPLSIADEGGFWPTDFKSNEEGLILLTEAIHRAGYKPMEDMAIALDIASSEFYNAADGTYTFRLENRTFSREEFVELLCGWAEKYPIVSIEDGMSEVDWEGYQLLTKRLGNKIQLIGDDLFTTNRARIQKGVDMGVCNAVLIKMNQIGTITETMDAIEQTKSSGYLPVISARSGETEDATIAHLTVAANAGQLKVGSVARSERAVKWNESIRIEEFLGEGGVYLSKHIFDRVIKE